MIETEQIAEAAGMPSVLRALQPADDSTLLAALLGCFIVNAFFFPILLRQWGVFFKQLLHQRADFMQEERTLTERIVVALALIQTVIFEGVTLYCATGAPAKTPLMSVAGLTLLAAALMAVQTASYLAVGYAFSAPMETRVWVRAFFLSQTMLGYLIAAPAMTALFYPNYIHIVLPVAAGAYIACRILFIIRGFAFFYTSPASLFYFFLYLCTLEIVPLAVVASLIGEFSEIFC